MYEQEMSVGDIQSARSAEVPRPQTDIESALSRLNEELNGAEKRLATLRDKLKPVMAEVLQNKEVEVEGYGGSPLAQAIQQRTNRVKLFGKELALILDSLQL